MSFFAGTLLAVLLHFPSACIKHTDDRLLMVMGQQLRIEANNAVESVTTPLTGLAMIDDKSIRYVCGCIRVRGIEVEEVEGNVQDGFVLVPSPPPKWW